MDKTVMASGHRQMGSPNVYAVAGGTSAWVTSGLTLARGRTQEEPLGGATLQALGYQRVSVLVGGMAAWSQAGLPVERGLSGVMSPPNDVLSVGTDRTWADAINYLRWEEKLGKKYEALHG